MKRVLLQNQKVQMIDSPEDYHELNVLLSTEDETEATASVPELGRVQVIREKKENYPSIDTWTMKERFLFTVEEDGQAYIARLDMPHVKKTCFETEQLAVSSCMFQFNLFQENRYVFMYQKWFIVVDDYSLLTWFENKKENVKFKLEVVK